MESSSPVTDNSYKSQRYIPPWKEPYIIVLAGSSGSGKTSIAQTIIKRLNVRLSLNWITSINCERLNSDNFIYSLGAMVRLDFYG